VEGFTPSGSEKEIGNIIIRIEKTSEPGQSNYFKLYEKLAKENGCVWRYY